MFPVWKARCDPGVNSSKLIYGYNTIPIKILAGFSVETDFYGNANDLEEPKQS